MRRPLSSWSRTFAALGFKPKKRKVSAAARRRGRVSKLEALEGRMLVAATTIEIHAAGNTGEEILTLQIDGQNVQSWTAIGGDFDAGIYEQIPYTSPDTVTADQVRLVFTNDGIASGGMDRDLRIDGISIDGEFFESEGLGVASEGSWNGVDCGFGFRQSEYLSCEGAYFQYAVGWDEGHFIVDTAIDEDDGDYSTGNRSLREALALATGSTTHLIEFDPSLAGATINLNDELHPTGNVDIIGLGSELLTIDARGTAANPRRAVMIDSNVVVTLTDLTITGGYADRGGAIRTEGGDLLLDQVAVEENHASMEGGGIYQLGGQLEINASTIEANTAQFGGGIYAALGDDAALLVLGSSVLYNTAEHANLDSAGGGVYAAGQPVGAATNAGDVLLFESTIAYNTSLAADDAVTTNHHAAGIYLSDLEFADIAHTTISSNRSTDTTSGLHLENAGPVALINSTIAFNELESVGGSGLTIAAGTLADVDNTIVAENRANGILLDVIGSFQSISTRNLIGSGSNPGGTNNTVLGAGDSAGLAPLADNGGGTLTHALYSTSPAVDGGSDTSTYDPGNSSINDQRGMKRYVNYVPGPTPGIVDIGAYELAPQIVATADFNGDGRSDQVHFDAASGNLDVVTDVGYRQESSSWGELLPPVGGANWTKFYSGDFNGDGRDDLAAYNATSGEWTLAISDGSLFIFNHLQLGTGDDNWQMTGVGDFDGDGSQELIGRTNIYTNWQMLQFDEQSGARLEDWGSAFGSLSDWTIFVGDVDQDGRDDLVARRPFIPGNWYAVISQPASITGGAFSSAIGLGNSLDRYFHDGNFTTTDFDGQFYRAFADNPNSVDVAGPTRDALALFSDVYNHVELEFYPGLKKGPQATRDTKGGSPWDQAALLAEDLLAAGFQAEIVTGKIELPVAELRDWIGTFETAAARGIVRLAFDENADYVGAGSELAVQFKHAWVRVQLPTASGVDWIDLDPSWKFKNRQPGIDIDLQGPRGAFDEFNYFADTNDQLPIEYFEDRVAEYLADNGIHASLAEVPYDGPIRRQQFATLPDDDRLIAATNVQFEGTFSDIVANDARDHTHQVRLKVGSWTHDIVVPESSLDNFTFLRDATSFTLLKNGIPEQTVSVPASTDELKITHTVPGESFAASEEVAVYPFVSGVAGQLYSVAINAGQHSAPHMDFLRQDLIAATDNGIGPGDIDDMLEYVGARYWQESNLTTETAAALNHAVYLAHEVESGVISSENALVSGAFDHLQSRIVPRNLTIDIGNSGFAVIDARYDASTSSPSFTNLDALELSNYTGSALEHAIIEETINAESVSTIQGLKDAYQGDPQISGYPSNSILVLESVIEGTERKVYLRGELGLRAAENTYIPYDPNRIDTPAPTEQDFRNFFAWHRLDLSGPNDALNNPAATAVWEALTEDIQGTGFAFMPWTHSFVGNSQAFWKGSVWYLSKQTASGASGGSFTIQDAFGGPPLNGGSSSGYVNPLSQLINFGASILRNFAGDPVDVLNGNMFRDDVDIVMPNVGVPLDFSRHYNSQSAYDVGMGVGWTHSFSDRLIQEQGATNELIWLTAEGVSHKFTKIGGVWKSPSALLGQLQEFIGAFAYVEPDGTEHHFQVVTPELSAPAEYYIARLTKVVDRNGHGVELEYANASKPFLPTQARDVNDGARYLDFTYTGDDHISTVSKHANAALGTWTFEYDASGTLLEKVTNPEQESISFEYDDFGQSHDLISTIIEPDDAYHAYEYYPNGRVFRVKEGVFDGTNYLKDSSHSFSYNIARNRTEFFDENGNAETYIHQDDGRLIRHVHDDGSRTITAWGVEDGNGGIVADTDYLMRSQTDETGAIETYEYFVNETGANAFKNRRLSDSTSPHLAGETPLVTEYDYVQAGAGFEHIVNVASIKVDPGSSDERTTTLQYDAKGRLEQATNPLNEVTNYDYFDDNHATSYLRGLQESETRPGSTTGATIETTFSYDSAGLITSAVTDNLPAGTVSYHHTGQPATVTDATGVTTAYSYDSLGRRTAATQLGDLADSTDDLVNSFEYDGRGRLIESTDALGRTTTWIYDRRGNVTQQVFADGSAIVHEYDAGGNRIVTTDQLGRVTKYFHDGRNRLVQTIYADGSSAATRYDGTGRVLATIDELGRESRLEYNAQGDVTSTITAFGTTDEVTTRTGYNQFNEVIQSVAGTGSVTQHVRDKLGRVTKTQILDALDSATPNAPGHTPVAVSTAAYDARGNEIKNVVYDVAALASQTTALLSDDPTLLVTTHPQFVQVTQTEFDAFNRPTEIIYADDTSIRTEYDDAGRVRFQYNELNRASERKYDDFGRLSKFIDIDPDGPSNPLTSPVTKYHYDAAGNQTEVIDANGNSTHFEYDALNRNVAILDAERGREKSLYDAAGQLVASLDALGRATFTAFDKRGREVLLRTADPDGDGPQPASRTRRKYDHAGNLIEETDPRGTSIVHEYDAQNRMIRDLEIDYAEVSAEVDDGDADFRIVTDTFPIEFQTVGYSGDSQFVSVPTSQDKATARWKLNDLGPGRYRLLATWEGRADASTNVTATISDAIPNLVIAGLDQTRTPTEIVRHDDGVSRGWVELVPELEITAASSGKLRVLLSSEKGTNLVADVVRLERIVDRHYTYDDNNSLTTSIDTLGRQTDYTYDELDRLHTTLLPDPDGTANPLPRPLTTFHYDGYGNVALTAENRGGQNRQRVVTYDQRNRILTETQDANANSAAEVTTSYGYDSVGNLTSRIDAAGTAEQVVTQYRYDRLNRLISEWYHADETVLSDWQQAEFTAYDALGNVIATTDRVRHVYSGQTLYHDAITEFEFDGLNRQTSVTRDAQGALAATTTFRYDAVGNQIQSADPLGRITRHVFDRLDRRVQTIAPDADGSASSVGGSIETFAYDPNGNLLSQTNGEGETQRSDYDSRGRVVRSFDALNAETRSAYDSEDNQITHTDPLGNRTTSTYDALNRLTLETITLDNTDVSRLYTYDGQENLASVTDRDGRITTFVHDRRGRRRFELWYDGIANPINTLEWLYDAHDRVILQKDTTSIETFDYDILDRVTAARNYKPNGAIPANPRVEQRWEYDILDPSDNDDFVRVQYGQHQIDQGVQLGQTTLTADRLGRTVQIVDNVGSNPSNTINYEYDLADQLLAITRTGDAGDFSFDSNIAYDLAGRVLTSSHTRNGSATPFTKYEYQYDLADRITNVSIDYDTTIGALSQVSANQSEAFSFDEAGQLQTDANSTYAYDENGNRTDTGFVTSAHNRLAEDADYNYTYDNEGNRIRRDSKTDSSYTLYSWDHRNRLTEVTDFDTSAQPINTVEYEYNVDNQLVSRTASGVTEHFLSQDGERVLELADSGNLQRRATWGIDVDQLLVDEVFDASGQLQHTLWAANDHSGSVRQLLDINENIVEHREYDSFGSLDQAFNATGVAIGISQLQSDVGFSGKQFDRDISLQYNNARWYDPSVGRFLSEDPTSFASTAHRHQFSGSVPQPSPQGL